MKPGMEKRSYRGGGVNQAVALVVGPALGGFILLGSLFPSPWIGGMLGALLGAVAGLVRNRELARLHG